ncbi:MAG: CoA activase [Actinobacteria bacterium]|nr:CoA activase [Actinomycetota bacterium]
MRYYIGYDIGAISVNRAVIDEKNNIIDVMPYTRHYGEPAKLIARDLEQISEVRRITQKAKIAFTGLGGKALSEVLEAEFINEIEALTTSVKILNPGIHTVIEIGGQDSKFIDLAAGDYAMNELCAAGTGSFLDQQASRFGLTIEEFCQLALKSEKPSTIAGRCSVFAKSDMIHLQQEAAKDEDIALGLCYAMARSFKSGIVKGKKFVPPIIFLGGVSFNQAMIRAFKDILKEDIFVPRHNESFGAAGAALALIQKDASEGKIKALSNTGGQDNNDMAYEPASLNAHGPDCDLADLLKAKQALEKYNLHHEYKKETFAPLSLEKSLLPDPESEKSSPDDYFLKNCPEGLEADAYIGIDVGSISTNVVAIDRQKRLIQKVYLRTAGRPIEAVRKGIAIIGDSIGDKINVKAVGTTGSGRYLIGDLVGADTIINEITAQATAAADIDPGVDTIFEIGGQDSKYIALEKGVVVDFEMNKICAAGTGSFLEEQSERFDVKIQDFGDRALSAKAPLNLGERCTVFMETNVYSHYQKGACIEDILGGLAYSIAINYINRVVARKKIGNKIFFQGAVAFNRSVVAAFENYLGKSIIVPPNHEVTGAIGTAIKAMENAPASSKFRGFEKIKDIKYSQSSFECRGCPNVCEIKKVTIENAEPLYYGGRCEKYEKKKTGSKKITDLFAQRDDILINSYKRSLEAGQKNKAAKPGAMQINGNTDTSVKINDENVSGKIKIGIPYTMLTYEFYPFWDAFFTELGMEVVLSEKTNKKIINDGLSFVVAETCFPMKVVLGHVKNLLDRGVDYIFIPGIRDMPCTDDRIEGSRTGSYPCPFVQGISTFVKASMDIDHSKILDPLINFSFREYLKNEQLYNLGKKLGSRRALINKAITAAYKAQQYFYDEIRQKGRQFFESLKKDQLAAVIISRPYNSCDANISMDIPGKLRDAGIQAVPLDYLPLESVDIFDQWSNMYWEFGDRILSAVEIIKKDRRLYPVYITNFGCGPDSFIMQYFEREIDRPYLKIEIDEHTAGAGVITRCEAFLDSLDNIKKLHALPQKQKRPGNKKEPAFKRKAGRKIFIPHMGDGSYAIKAAFKSAGIDAEVMLSDYETLELGRKYTLGKECYPYIVTTGDILKTLKHNDPEKCAFLMPLTHGPCRFGQYNKMQKILLDELGYDVPIIAPGAIESSQFYKEYDMQGRKGLNLYLKALAGVITIDYLNKFLRKKRPYEAQKGESDRIYESLLKKVIQSIEQPQGSDIIEVLTSILQLAVYEFEDIKSETALKPLIGVVGEIYVRNHPYSNNELVRKIEEMGGEVELPDFSEWAYHTNATGRLDISIKQKDVLYKIFTGFKPAYASFNGNGSKHDFNAKTEFKEIARLLPNLAGGAKFYIANRLFKKLLDRYHVKLERPLKNNNLISTEAENIYDIWDNAEPYIIKWFGEAALSIGKSIEWIKKDIDGIVNVLPFTCMPGTMVTAASKSIREKYKTPWLNLAFDGLEQGTTETRLEAFMYQAKQHKIAKAGNKEDTNVK